MYETCRFCDKEDESVVVNVESYVEQIHSLTNIQIKLDDDFPSKFCEECMNRLTNAIAFRDMCLRSEEMLVVQTDNMKQLFDPTERSSSPESQLLLNLGASMTLENMSNRFGQKDWNDMRFVRDVIKKKDLKLIEIKPLPPPPPPPRPLPKPANPEPGEIVEDTEFLDPTFDDYDEEEVHEPKVTDEFEGYEALPPGAEPKMGPGKLPKQGPWICQPCGLSYHNKNSFHTHWYHKHKHAGRKYICEECGRVYEKATQLKEHLNVHLPVKPYQCDLCGARFSRKYAVVNHMFSHTKKKRYQCPYCPKAYTFYSDIQRHETSHTGVYIYNCQICKKGYNRKKQLLEHEREHIVQ